MILGKESIGDQNNNIVIDSYVFRFSVEVNSETKLALTRYKCWENPISGCIEIGMTGVCVLRWDNSYSKRKFSVPLAYDLSYYCFSFCPSSTQQGSAMDG